MSQTLRLSAPEYVKISSNTLTIDQSDDGEVRAVLDPKLDQLSLRGYVLVVADDGSTESGEVRFEFPLDDLMATTFDIATSSYSFTNWEEEDKGHCFGMSETSILYCEKKIDLPNGVENTYALSKDLAKEKIEAHQDRFLARFSDFDWWPWTEPADWYEEVKEGIQDGHPMILIIREPNKKTHAAVAYKIAEKGNQCYVFVYENQQIYQISDDRSFPYAVYNSTEKSFTYIGEKIIGVCRARKLPSEWASQLSSSFSNELRVIFQCPLNITITDPYGRAISDTGLAEIPGATVVRDETITFWLPPGIAYSIDINAYKPGFFSVAIVQPPNAARDSIRIVVFDRIVVLETTRATIDLPEHFSNLEMKIDEDGDGIIDEECFPDFSRGGASDVSESVSHGPNPVTSAGTAFFFSLPDETSTAKLMILSPSGRLMFETVLDADSSRFPSAGTWNPVGQDGTPLANGPYVYVLIADGRVIGQGKMVIQR